VSRLVALDLPAGPTFVDELRRIWDAGEAVLPIDQRLDHEAKQQLCAAMGAGAVVDSSNRANLDEGWPVASGDALVMATSGTTGAAKGVVLTHDALQASADASNRALAVGPNDHWLSCLPLSHVGGLSVVIRSLLSGTRLTVHESFRAPEVKRAALEGCTLVSLVPTAWRRINSDLFRMILLGGSAPPSNRPSNVVATYGLTETGSGVVYDGRPLDDVEVQISDAGEVLLRCPMLMREYRDGTTSIDDLGWLHTGDAGTFESGLLAISGRLDDLIKSGGEKVWPEEVERAIRQETEITDFCIIGVDDPEWGQKVVLVTTQSGLHLSDVRAKVKEVLPAFCAPKEIVVVDELPATSLGKIRRREVSKLAARILAERA
jgi:O-succinylbenzoic acid--CoA ligase